MGVVSGADLSPLNAIRCTFRPAPVECGVANAVVLACTLTAAPEAQNHPLWLELLQERESRHLRADDALYAAADLAGALARHPRGNHGRPLSPEASGAAIKLLGQLHRWMDELPRKEQRRA